MRPDVHPVNRVHVHIHDSKVRVLKQADQPIVNALTRVHIHDSKVRVLKLGIHSYAQRSCKCVHIHDSKVRVLKLI